MVADATKAAKKIAKKAGNKGEKTMIRIMQR